MSDRLVLTPGARAALLDHARDGLAPPREVCGVLAGERAARGDAPGADTTGDSAGEVDGPDRVTATREVPNVADRPRSRYELDPEATYAAIEAVEAAGHDLVGFYHSHPEGPPRPSATDRAQATWPGYVYCIVVPPDDLRAWRWTGDRFDPLVVDVA